MKRFYLLIISILPLFIHCDKEDGKGTDILLNKTWKVGFMDKNPQSNPQGKILYHAWQECEKDDVYTFYTDKEQLVIENGDNKCLSSEPSEETLSFSIDKDKKVLTIGNETFTIADFSESQIKYYAPIPVATDYYIVYLLQ